MSPRKPPIWDLPTRLFHWSLALLVPAAWLSEELGKMELHEWCGYAVIVLVAFRIAWGVVGSRHSRFSDFLRGPRAVIAYLRGSADGGEGHNPAGGWSVVALLALVTAQAVTGLYNKDDFSFAGPLQHTVSATVADALGEWHEINFTLLLALVALHVGAIVFYHVKRGRNLLRPMITGGESSVPGIKTTPAWVALPLLAACAGLLYWLLSRVPAPQVFL